MRAHEVKDKMKLDSVYLVSEFKKISKGQLMAWDIFSIIAIVLNILTFTGRDKRHISIHVRSTPISEKSSTKQ